MWEYRDPDELYHWGVLGMKWGHRKSQWSQNKKERKKAKEFNLKRKWALQDKAKKDRISEVDSKINKKYDGNVNTFKRRNRYKMAGIAALGAGAIKIHNRVATNRFVNSLNIKQGLGIVKISNLKKSSNPISKLMVKRQISKLSKDRSLVKSSAKYLAAVGIGTAVIGAYFGKKIYNKHKQNKIANDYYYRQSLKKKKK